jgi:transcriptional regulator with XRE-family HTH domain
MQETGRRRRGVKEEVSGAFGERAKAARLRAGLTQEQLSHRLLPGVVLDTSAITRIEAGQREPRLSEALVIARVLGFELHDLAGRADLDYYMSDVKRLMTESRSALVRMLQSVDPVVDFVRQNPARLGDDRLEDRFRELVEWFHQRLSNEDSGHEDDQTPNFAVTRNRTDEELKRQLLRAVSDRILVTPDELQPAYDRWFKKDVSEKRSPRDTSHGRQPVESRAGDEQWEKLFGELLNYVRRHGDARVRRSYVTPDGGRLGTWVVDQRNRFARGMLDPDRSVRLEELPGWTWAPRGG